MLRNMLHHTYNRVGVTFEICYARCYARLVGTSNTVTFVSVTIPLSKERGGNRLRFCYDLRESEDGDGNNNSLRPPLGH